MTPSVTNVQRRNDTVNNLRKNVLPWIFVFCFTKILNNFSNIFFLSSLSFILLEGIEEVKSIKCSYVQVYLLLIKIPGMTILYEKVTPSSVENNFSMRNQINVQEIYLRMCNATTVLLSFSTRFSTEFVRTTGRIF